MRETRDINQAEYYTFNFICGLSEQDFLQTFLTDGRNRRAFERVVKSFGYESWEDWYDRGSRQY